MRVLFLLNTVGAGSGPLQRAMRLAARGHEVTVLTFLDVGKWFGDPRLDEEVRNTRAACETENLKIESLGGARFSEFRLYGRLFAYIRRGRFDAVFAHHNAMGTLGLFVARIAGCARVYKVELGSLAGRSPLQRMLDLPAFALARGIVCISASTAATFSGYEDRLFGRKKRVIYNGINLADAGRAEKGAFRARHGIAPETFVAVLAARFHPVKNHALILDAFAEFHARVPDSMLALAGVGVLEREVRARAKELGLEDAVLFTGYLARAEVYEMLAGADAYVMASLSEGLSEALLQAMSSRLPSVLTDIPSFRETVNDGIEGFIAGDVESYARALERLALDTELRRRMGRAARDRAESVFSIESVINTYEALIGGKLG